MGRYFVDQVFGDYPTRYITVRARQDEPGTVLELTTTTNVSEGMGILGDGIPEDTYVDSVVDTKTIYISEPTEQVINTIITLSEALEPEEAITAIIAGILR